MVKKIRKKKKVVFYSKKGDMERTDYDDGSRSISMTAELEEAFKEQRKQFIEKIIGFVLLVLLLIIIHNYNAKYAWWLLYYTIAIKLFLN